MKRREFITLLGAAAAWPVVARAQQSVMPAIGYLTGSPNDDQRMNAFRQALADAGLVEGKNVSIAFRAATGRFDKLPQLAADLVHRKVDLIVARGSPAAKAAKSETNTIPIVFMTGGDPVRLGFVKSFNRPAGNMTGVTRLSHHLAAKQLELLHEILPAAATVAVMLNPGNPNSESDAAELQVAAELLKRRVQIFNAANETQINAAIASMVEQRCGAMLVGNDGYFLDRSNQFVQAAAAHKLPSIYTFRDFVDAGGLMSYASSSIEAMRLAGAYAARILKGEQPADMPVMQPTTFELVINLKTAKALGLTVPPTLLARADEVIE